MFKIRWQPSSELPHSFESASICNSLLFLRGVAFYFLGFFILLCFSLFCFFHILKKNLKLSGLGGKEEDLEELGRREKYFCLLSILFHLFGLMCYSPQEKTYLHTR